MKLDKDALSNDPEKIAIDAIDIREADSGLRKTVEAIKPASSNEKKDIANPVVNSKTTPAVIMSRIFSSLFAALRWAMYLVIAESTPQSRNRLIVSDGIKTMEYKPYSSGIKSLARIIVPTAIITVDIAVPVNSWKLPAAELLPIFNAFSKRAYILLAEARFSD
jgi:hypothetical protein